jgi:hypothetical protein
MLILIVGIASAIQIAAQGLPRDWKVVVKMSLTAEWAVLDLHFKKHWKLVNRFREAGGDAVIRMWRSQTKEDGERLSKTERDALIERHCELFGTWPD